MAVRISSDREVSRGRDRKRRGPSPSPDQADGSSPSSSWLLGHLPTFFGPSGPPGSKTRARAAGRIRLDVLDLDDQPVAFSKFKGKTIFLNFWATWCPPCVGEMPSIDAAGQRPAAQGEINRVPLRLDR